MAPQPPLMWQFLLAALGVPVLVIALSLWLSHEYSVTQRMALQARAAFERRAEADTLIARIADAESGQRGYVITGDANFLAGYAPARAEVMQTFDKLRIDLSADSEQVRLLDQLHGLASRKFAEMDGVIAQRRNVGLQAAVASVRDGNGKSLMDQMRAVSARILQRAARERDHRVDTYQTRVDADRIGMWIGIAVTGFLLLASAVLVWRQRIARYRARLAAYVIAERNRSILDSTIDAILILNPSGTIETINAAASTMLGYRSEDLIRRDISVLVKQLDRPLTFHQRIGLIDGKLVNPYLSDRRVLRNDGQEIPVDIALAMMPLPDGDHVVASFRDISQRKQVERMKDELISTVSHELRTPLTSVVGALGLLRSGSAGEISPAAARLVEIAENNSRRLIRLINDMLDIDRIQSGQLRLDLAPLDLRDVVRRACDGSEGLAASAGIVIACDLPDIAVMVMGDADRLLQVVTNLTSNAIRVSPPDGTVTIGLSQADGKAQITIDDDGAGVPVEFRDRIFGRFERAQDADGVGTGLGLAISREIIERLDGAIRFEDRPGGGTRFAFVLDLLREPAIRDNSTDRPRILICEDDADMAETLRQMVFAIGHRADCVSTAADARTALADGTYSALLLDLRLPDESGLSVAQSLRMANGRFSLPIIVVSGLSRDGMVEAMPFEFVDWLDKPIDPDRLADAVRNAVERSGAAQPVILHLDDDRDILDIVESALKPFARVLKATDLATARRILETELPNAAILDLDLGEGSGLELLPMLIDRNGLAIPTIIFSAHDVTAVAASKVSAVLVKSRGSLPDLKATVCRILNDRGGAG